MDNNMDNNMDNKKYDSLAIHASDKVLDETDVETDNHPMSEKLYNQLSQIHGFTEMNGSTYIEYVKNWKQRKEG